MFKTADNYTKYDNKTEYGNEIKQISRGWWNSFHIFICDGWGI